MAHFEEIRKSLIDTFTRFERKFKDVEIYLNYEDSGIFRIRMNEKRNPGRCIETLLSEIQIKDANSNIFWFTLENMRNKIIKYNN